MKKFTSRFSTLLKIRQNKEDNAKKKLIDLFAVLQKMLKQQQHLDEEISELSSQQKDGKSFSAENASKTAFYVEHLQKERKHLDKFIKDKIEQANQARLEVVETTKQRKLIENIENKENNKWRKLREKKEEQFFDDISSSRFIKKRFQLKKELKSSHEKDTQDF